MYIDMSHIRGVQAAVEGSNWRQSKVREGLGQSVHLCGTADKYESKIIEIQGARPIPFYGFGLRRGGWGSYPGNP